MNMMMDNNMERENCLRRLSEVSFAVHEAVLFLDTHPTDRMALDYYQRYKMLRKKILEEYTERFGPMKADDVRATNEWTWATAPWPWETED